MRKFFAFVAAACMAMTMNAEVLTVAQAITLGNALEDNAQTDTVEVQGYAVNVAKYDVGFGNQEFYLADDATSTSKDLMAFRAKPTKNDQPYPVLAGDKVILRSVIKKYVKNEETPAQLELMYPTVNFVEEVPGDRSIGEVTTITVTEALTIGSALASGATTDDTYDIVGYISQIDDDSYETSYKNMTFWITDVAGSSAATNADGAFEVYRGKPDQHLELGDKIQITTKIQKYSKGDVIESVSGATVKFLEKGDAPTPEAINVNQAVEIALALGDNETTTANYAVSGYVAKVYEEFNTQYNNLSFYMTDDPTSTYGDLQCRRAKMSAEEGPTLAAGDKVLIVGKLTNNFYNDKNTPQIYQGQATIEWKSAIENILLNDSKINKVIVDGVMYIVRDGKMFDVRGAQVR